MTVHARLLSYYCGTQARALAPVQARYAAGFDTEGPDSISLTTDRVGILGRQRNLGNLTGTSSDSAQPIVEASGVSVHSPCCA